MAKKATNLDSWEVAIVKAMLAKDKYNDQVILSYFTRPTRSINHRVIAEIRSEKKHKARKPASDEELNKFLAAWPEIDPETGLHLKGDELLIKAREAMIAAVQTFNSAGITFRSELFIVTSIIAWTYLLHAWFKREGIDYRYKDKAGEVQKTKEGADRYWELGACLKHKDCPVPIGAKNNLNFLLEIRHEIEHRSTDQIETSISAKLQACCINFNRLMIKEFGVKTSLEDRLSIALQFSGFDVDQKTALKSAVELPGHLAAAMDAFQDKLTKEQLSDPSFAYKAWFVPKTSNSSGKSDAAIEIIKAGTPEALNAEKIFLKEVDKTRFTATDVISKMKEEGFVKFNQAHHTKLWKSLEARNPAKAFGRTGDYTGSWVWYESWVERVRLHCHEQGELYQ